MSKCLFIGEWRWDSFGLKTKFLCIIIDEHLEWKVHIDLCKRNISSGNYILKSQKIILSTSSLTTIYYSMIHPYLPYGIMFWDSACKQHLHKIEVLQKSFKVYTRLGTMNTQCHYFTWVKLKKLTIYTHFNYWYLCI